MEGQAKASAFILGYGRTSKSTEVPTHRAKAVRVMASMWETRRTRKEQHRMRHAEAKLFQNLSRTYCKLSSQSILPYL